MLQRRFTPYLSLLACLCVFHFLLSSPVKAQDKTPHLDLSQTQRVGSTPLGYVTLPSDFSQKHDEELFKEWTNADETISVILRQLPIHQASNSYPDASQLQHYLMDYTGKEIGQGHASFVLIEAIKPEQAEAEGQSLLTHIRLQVNNQPVPTLMNYNLIPAFDKQEGAQLLLIRVSHYAQDSQEAILTPLLNSWAPTP